MSKKGRAAAAVRPPEASTNAAAAAAAAAAPVVDEDVDMNDSMRLLDDEAGGTNVCGIYIPPSVKPHCSTESSGPRLVITSIVNTNFKSYAGEVQLGPFFHRFHSVIGPNGSGKSNVIDSMLFVFGYRAKRLRCQKLSTLLHNSAKYPNVSSCRVAVHFHKVLDNADGTATPQPGTAFFISRTAFADNSSQYTINDRRATFKDVAQLLKQHDVDLDHNRFLILQGEVESIAMMKSKATQPNECGLLEYFEDIIGTSRYKEPLDKIAAVIELLTEERTEKHNRCKLAEREMRELVQPKDEAIAYLEQENNLTRNVNLHVQKYVSEQLVALRELGEERDEHKATLAAHDERFEAMAQERQAKEATIREERQRYDAMAKRKLELEQMLKRSLNKFAEIQSAMDATNKRRKEWRRKAQLTKEQAALVEWRATPEKNAAEIAECEKKVAKLQAKQDADRAQLADNAAALEERTAPALQDKERAETELIGLQQTVDECGAAVQLAENELRLCTDAETMERRKLETFKNAFADATAAVTEKRERAVQLEHEMADVERELAAKQATMKANADRERVLVAQVQKQRADLEEVQRNAQQARSNDKVLDALMQQKLSGQIPGILGRLGDLGGIAAKYDVAISTCCGRLDNIIVDTVKTAQECIAYLKRTNVGRANFVALEKVAHLAGKAAQRIQTPENTPRLFDLVHYDDPRMAAVFYFALNDTLVADDLKHGSRIAYGARRWRVVTLAGGLIETSGTMAGGGNRQIRGKMGEKVKTKSSAAATAAAAAANRSSLGAAHGNVDELRRVTQELQNEVNFLQEQQGQLERDCAQLQQRLRAADAELKRLRLQLAGLEQHLPRQQQQVEQQQLLADRTRADPARCAELEANIAASRERLKQAQANTTGLVERVATANAAIQAIHSELVGALEKRIADQTKQQTVLKKNITKLNVAVGTAERNAAKAEAHIAQLADDIKQAEDTLRRDNEERAQVDTDSVQLTTRIEAAAAELEAASSDSSDTKREITAMLKREADGQMARLELAAQLQTADKKIAEVENSVPHWRNKLRPLKLNVIPMALEGSAEQRAQLEQDERDGKLTLKTYTDEELAEFKLEDLQYTISILEEDLKKQKPNLSVVEEFYRKRVVYLERVTVLEDITKKRTEMSKVFDEVRKRRSDEFHSGFQIISLKLREMYRMITLGGDAELELVDSMDPFTDGVQFSVRPPKKTWKNISNLSGGEKTLSSLALVFALHYYKPSPLYFLDEIDAALDFKNVSIVAHYIKARTKNAQFIIISLRSNMFDLCDYLTGIYKVQDCTKSVTIANQRPDNPDRILATGVVTSTQVPEPDSQTIADDPRVQEISMIEAPAATPPVGSQRRISYNAAFDAMRCAVPELPEVAAAAAAAERSMEEGALVTSADGSLMAVDETIDETQSDMMDTSTVSLVA